jgi:hypothetical protein
MHYCWIKIVLRDNDNKDTIIGTVILFTRSLNILWRNGPFGLTITIFIYTSFTIITAVINRAHCSRILLISLSQISLSSHILYFGHIALTVLEPSTSLKPHYPVPLSVCRLKIARCFAAPLQTLPLVSTGIGRWWTPESLVIRSLPRRDMAPSPSAHCYRRGTSPNG